MVTDQASLSTLTAHVEAYEPDIDRVLIPARRSGEARRAGEQIGNDYAGRKLLLAGVLKGAFVVTADLARYIRLPLEFDFMAVSSYGAATQTSGVVRILKDLDHDLEGLDVLLVEDIVDSGLTFIPALPAEEPARAQAGVPGGGGPAAARWTTSGCPWTAGAPGSRSRTVFVVGYALGYAERFRNLRSARFARRRTARPVDPGPRIR